MTCFILAPIGSPRNLTADPGMQNVTLMWLAPIQPNGIITYSYYIIDDEDMTVANGTTMDLSVTVTGLTEFTNYTCNVTASTSVGSTDPATEMFTTLQGSMCDIYFYFKITIVACPLKPKLLY